MDQHVMSNPNSKLGCITLAVCGLFLWLIATSAHAASVYKCMDAQGHLAYRDTPCAAHAHQRKVELQPLPTIGDASEVAAQRRMDSASGRVSSRKTRGAPRKHPASRSTRGNPEKTSWECRAADGEVFYRHARCPGSVPGDGTVRNDYVADSKGSRTRTRSRQGAWGRVSVHGEKISRAEACRRIHSAGAAGRDGHARDETVSTYDHLVGRDPCGN